MKDYTKALRKYKLVHSMNDYWYYPHFGQYRKGKIHCSCPLCRAKVKYEGYGISDLRKFERLNYSDDE